MRALSRVFVRNTAFGSRPAFTIARRWYGQVHLEELKQKIAKPPAGFFLVDVREPEEVAQGIIPGAKHVPVGEMEQALKLSPADFEKKYGFPKPTADCHVVFYCRKGVRAATAAQCAENLGYKKACTYPGSWAEWESQC